MGLEGLFIGIIGTAVLIAASYFIAVRISRTYRNAKLKTVIYGITVLLVAGWWICLAWCQQGLSSGASVKKLQNSGFTQGVEKIITVYDTDGDVLEQYRGKFDLEYGDECITFNDIGGNRHLISYSSGTVTVHEVSGSSVFPTPTPQPTPAAVNPSPTIVAATDE